MKKIINKTTKVVGKATKAVSKVVTKTKSLLNPNTLLKNSILFSILTTFLILYGPRLHPALPSSLRNLFNNSIFRGTIIFLIVYLANHNLGLSLTITIIFIVTLGLIQKKNNVERFNNYGTPVSNCGIYNNAHNVGTAFYPLNGNDALQHTTENQNPLNYGSGENNNTNNINNTIEEA